MENIAKVLSDLSSWYWWFSVVLVGLLINLASSYLKPQIDAVYGKFTATKREKNEQDRRNFELRVEALVATPSLIALEGFDELRERLVGLFALAGGFAFAWAGLSVSRATVNSGFVYFAVGACFGATLTSFVFAVRVVERANSRSKAMAAVRAKLGKKASSA